MSKAIGKFTGTGKVKVNSAPTDEFVNFLNKYDTKNVDNTLSNLTSYANQASQNLADRLGNYTFSVDASDEARKRAENATYQAYVDRLNPQFERQTDDLQTRLANQGLPVGSEAYSRAMGDMLEKQNEAYNQAGYQSVLAGQDAFNQDLQNQINAGSFGNQAQQAYINQLLSALQGSSSGYDKALDKYSAMQGLAAAKQQAQAQTNANRAGFTNSLMNAGAQLGGSAMMAAALSDERVKENLNKIAEVDGFNIYEFNYIGQDKKEVGVIAQEMLEKCPDCVIENYQDSGYYGVDYSKLPEKVQNKIKELR